MPKHWKRWFSSLFPRIVLIFLVVTAPIYTLSLLMNGQGERIVRDEITNSLQSRADFYLNALESEISRIMQLQRLYILDKDIQNISFASTTLNHLEWSQAILRIQNKLQLIENSSMYIEHAKVHLLTIGRSISGSSGLLEAIDAQYEELARIPVAGRSPFLYQHGRMFIRLSFLDRAPSQREPAYVLDIELSVAELLKSIHQFVNYEQAGAILFDPDNDWKIGNEPDEDLVAAMQALGNRWHADADDPDAFAPLQVGSAKYAVTVIYSKLLAANLLIYIPEKQVLGKLDLYPIWFWVLSGLSVAVLIVFAYWIYRRIHKPLSKLVRAFRRVEAGQLDAAAFPQSHDEFHYLFAQFNTMVGKLSTLIHEVYEQKIRTQSAELKQLQSQINPHFLYNTCFLLHRMAQINDQENMIRLSEYLGEYFQFVTRIAVSEVPLEAEWKHARTYVDIQNLRFSHRIETEMAPVPEAFRQLQVPRLIIQPLLENAYQYGMASRRSGGRVRLSFDNNEQYLYLLVEDNGKQMNEQKLAELREYVANSARDVETTGIRNVHRRLQLRFGQESGLSFSMSELGGLAVRLVIHLHGKEAVKEETQ